jgi:hypothetical protein
VVERTVASLLKDIIGNVQQIIRAEVRLAKVEVAEELARRAAASRYWPAGALFGVMALGFFCSAQCTCWRTSFSRGWRPCSSRLGRPSSAAPFWSSAPGS